MKKKMHYKVYAPGALGIDVFAPGSPDFKKKFIMKKKIFFFISNFGSSKSILSTLHKA